MMSRTVLLLMFLTLPAVAADSPRWSYAGKDGPQAWGRLHKDWGACSQGRRQSPINITKTKKESLPPIEYSYQPSALRVLNDGRTVQVNVDAGSTIRISTDSYQLKMLQVHTPSEEQIQGKAFDVGIHFLHQNDAGQWAVVAVLYKQGRLNAALQPLWRNLPTQIAPERTVEGVQINPADLLPANKGYYSYEGSLTTPPCSEGVRWLVLKEPVEMSKAQVMRVQAIFHRNARPVQPLHGRVVKESQ